MSWQDRDYNQSGNSGGSALLNMLNGSVPLGKWFGIRVRVHASLIIFIGITLLLDYSRGYTLGNRLISMGVLFGIVLLHEFGHCFAARMVGGSAHDILMWPLGGLASADAPHRPGAQFWTVAGGPLVNVLLCAITATVLWYMGVTVSLNPFHPLPTLNALLGPTAFYIAWFLWWVFVDSYLLLLFNLMPVFPLDGGQLVQAALWPSLGYFKSMNIACVTGMIGAAIMGLYGLAAGQWLLLFIAISGFSVCYRRRQYIKEIGPEGLREAMEFSEATRESETPRPRRHLSRRFMRKAHREAAREQVEQARIDSILEKVSQHGMQSITWWERRVLHKATERQRQRDLEYHGENRSY